MGIRSRFTQPLAEYYTRSRFNKNLNGIDLQNKIFQTLIKEGSNTRFGQDHRFHQIKTLKAYQAAVPIRDYESFRPYIEMIKNGESDVLWKGKPLYFAKTSGTTSGAKYIPISKDSISNHIKTARAALIANVAKNKEASFFTSKMIFLSGSPDLDHLGCIPTGRLSGIVNHHIPAYLRINQLPSLKTNRIEDWESKLNKIVEESIGQDLRFVSGIPPWIQMYFEFLQAASGGKTIKEIFPNLEVVVHGGVNFQPYEKQLKALIGGKVDFVECYPASEGFFAYHDGSENPGMLLNIDSGIFFEFVPLDELKKENPVRLDLSQINLQEDYAVVISSNAGLWSYLVGDTIRFVSLQPYRIIVTGRISQYISAFGEHVIASEVESALAELIEATESSVKDFTVAPKMKVGEELPCHEWFVEFDQEPENLEIFASKLDALMCKKNIYYNDLIQGGILQKLKVRSLPPNSFKRYMESIGKLGGQNKIPHLSNDRKIVDQLSL